MHHIISEDGAFDHAPQPHERRIRLPEQLETLEYRVTRLEHVLGFVLACAAVWIVLDLWSASAAVRACA